MTLFKTLNPKSLLPEGEGTLKTYFYSPPPLGEGLGVRVTI